MGAGRLEHGPPAYWQLKTWAEGGTGGAEIIADENGIYPDRMGVAGRRPSDWRTA